MLLCTLIPLLKDTLGNIICSVIAGGCLILTLVDLIILELENIRSQLKMDEVAVCIYKPKTGIAILLYLKTCVFSHKRYAKSV